jgi:hypothetical protein
MIATGTPSRAVRAASALLSLALVLLVICEAGGVPRLGWMEVMLLLMAFISGSFCFAPFEWNARGLAVVASTLLTLFVAELGGRLFLSPRYYAPFQLDARLLYALVPDARREHRRAAVNGGDRVLYRVNSAGFRGDELVRGRRTIRILLYGDSFIQAEYSELEHTFAERLERRLSGGLGTESRSRERRRRGLWTRPDPPQDGAGLPALHRIWCSALFAGNDGDLVRNKLYRLDGRESRRDTFMVDPELARKLQRSRGEWIVKKIAREALRARLHGGEPWVLDERAPARRERMESFLAQAAAEYRQYVLEGDNVVRELLRDPYNADVSLTPNTDSARYKIVLMDRTLAAMKDLSEEHRTPLAFVLIPHPIDVEGTRAARWIARYPDYSAERLDGPPGGHRSATRIRA